MFELVCVGKVINFFGIKGELKILSNFDKISQVFKEGMKILINNQELIISSVRKHKNYILITVNDWYDINLITKYIGYNVYVRKEDLNLKDDEYLVEELVGAIIKENEKEYGIVKETLLVGNTYYIKVIYNKKTYLVPVIDRYIVRFAKDEKILYTRDVKSLIL